jgi:hypothetical protein
MPSDDPEYRARTSRTTISLSRKALDEKGRECGGMGEGPAS